MFDSTLSDRLRRSYPCTWNKMEGRTAGPTMTKRSSSRSQARLAAYGQQHVGTPGTGNGRLLAGIWGGLRAGAVLRLLVIRSGSRLTACGGHAPPSLFCHYCLAQKRTPTKPTVHGASSPRRSDLRRAALIFLHSRGVVFREVIFVVALRLCFFFFWRCLSQTLVAFTLPDDCSVQHLLDPAGRSTVR